MLYFGGGEYLVYSPFFNLDRDLSERSLSLKVILFCLTPTMVGKTALIPNFLAITPRES